MTWLDGVSLLGGLGLLLFGIRTLGNSLEEAAGSRMKKLLEQLTRNRLMSVGVGALVTIGMQSSTATTLMVVGFVNAGLLTLSRAAGVIMGANIGTTVTALMLSVKVDFGAIFTALGGLCFLLSHREKAQLIGKIMMGVGMLFLGMQTMTSAAAPLGEMEGFRNLMLLAQNPLLGVPVGALMTAVLSSSAACVGLLQAMRVSGALPMRAAMFILFGQNIGTCLTALLSSAGASRTAKRAALVHLLFNVVGTALFVILALVLPLDQWVIALAGEDNLGLQVAVTHILFNGVTTLVLLPACDWLVKLACLLVPGEDAPKEGLRMQYFDNRFLTNPPVAVEMLFREVGRMSALVMENYRFSLDFYASPEGKTLSAFEEREELIDFLNGEITQALTDVKGKNLPRKEALLSGSLFHVVNDLERIGDHATNIVEIGQALEKEQSRFSPTAQEEIRDLTARVTEMLERGLAIVENQSTDKGEIARVEELEEQVDALSESLADAHVERVKEKLCTPRNGMLYLDMLNNLERIADHADNLATGVDDGLRAGKAMLW